VLTNIHCDKAGLNHRRRVARSKNEYLGLLRKYEMILPERISRQGFDSLDTKATLVSIEAIHRELGHPDRSLEQCKAFVEGYTYEKKRQVSPTDVKQQFDAIHLAAAFNDYPALRIILAAGYSVHDLVERRPFKYFDHTALHICSWYNDDPNECVDLLINAGAVALPVAGEQNRSPAHIAASKGHVRLIKAFERHYGSQSLRDCFGLLQLAMAEKQRETVEYLLGIGAPMPPEGTWAYFSPLTGDCKRGILPLRYALEHAWTSVATILINKRIAGSHDNESFAPLLHPNVTGREAMIRLLVRWADIDADGKDEFGQTQLSWAARLGYEAAVQFLVDWEQITADSRDKSGRTPLSWAASSGHMSVVQTLVRREDVTVDSRDDNGQAPLSWVARGGHEAVVRLLLEKGADIAAKEESGEMALQLAAEKGHEAVVRLLLEKGADVNAQNKYVGTALHLAARKGDEAVVRLLLEKGADIAAKDEYGRTALQIAAMNGYKTIVRLLTPLAPNS
jgi:ankyrin repeat protein